MTTKNTKKIPVKGNTTIKKSGNTFNVQWLWMIGIIAFTAIVFANSISKNFMTLDDPAYIKDNPYIKSLAWSNIVTIFTTFSNANYHPITTLLWAIFYKLFKLNANPYHLLNLTLHLANTGLVFVLLNKLISYQPFNSVSNKSTSYTIPVVGALLFGIHPMHVESVAWISELKDVLYSFFYLFGLVLYLKFITEKQKKYLWLAFLFLLLSVLSKSAAITFTLILFVIDFYFRRGWNKEVLIEKIPFVLLSIIFGIVTIMSQNKFGAITASHTDYSIFQRFFVVCYALVFYLVKLFLPIKLSAFYYFPQELPYYYYICPVIIAGIILLIAKAKALKHDLIFGFLFYLGSIILVVQIVPVGYSVVSERYSYIPYIGLFFIFGKLFLYLENQYRGKKQNLINFVKYGFFGVIILLSIMSYERIKVWHDSVTLFKDLVEKNPESSLPYFGLGKVQDETGDHEGALASFNKSIEIDPLISEVYFYRGNVYSGKKNYEMAVNDYMKAVSLDSIYDLAYYNLGAVYHLTGQYELSVEYYSKGMAIKPSRQMYSGRAASYFSLQKYDESILDFTEALKYDPNDAFLWYDRAVCYFTAKQMDKACSDWHKASSLGATKANEFIAAYCK